jgi:hypothetical protein
MATVLMTETAMTQAPAHAGDPVLRAHASLIALSTWMEARVKPVALTQAPSEWQRWQAELQSIRAILHRPQSVRIAMVGTTGAGKSTFLNALLGQRVLPVGVGAPVTAFVTLVRHHTNPSYDIEVEFASRAEWKADIDRYLQASTPGEDEGDGEGVMKRTLNTMRKRIEAVLGTKLPSDVPMPDLHAMVLPETVEQVLSGTGQDSRTFDNAKAMQAHLRAFIQGDSALWPLVKQVTITGPYDCLRGGIELVDLPGTNDPNEARVEVTREFLRSAPFVWLVFSMERGLTQDIQTLLHEEKLLRSLVLCGSYRALSLIGTKADLVNASSAEQFGLDEDCELSELIQAYQQHAIGSARKQLEDMVDSLVGIGEHPDTAQQMSDLARRAPIFTVSSEAYNKINKIVSGRKDYGLDHSDETGIPDVLNHLRTLADEVGQGLTGRTVQKRVEHLRDEMALFFRSRAAQGSPAVTLARAALHDEVTRLVERSQEALGIAQTQLDEKRTAFINRMAPLFRDSVRGVRRTCQGWHQIHWATLRAIVAREGLYKSPSNGRVYDLNGDLTDPLIDNLPVAWEHYFTTELGAIRDELALRLTHATEEFCFRAGKLAQTSGGKSPALVQQQLAAFRKRVKFEKQESARRVTGDVNDRRRTLAYGMSNAAKEHMLPAYERASRESGHGVKGRMLGHLTTTAQQTAPIIFETIQQDLTEALTGLEALIGRLFDELAAATQGQAGLVAQNVTLDLDEAAIAPEIRQILDSVPDLP